MRPQFFLALSGLNVFTNSPIAISFPNGDAGVAHKNKFRNFDLQKFSTFSNHTFTTEKFSIFFVNIDLINLACCNLSVL
jgi:hypothetical protein